MQLEVQIGDGYREQTSCIFSQWVDNTKIKLFYIWIYNIYIKTKICVAGNRFDMRQGHSESNIYPNEHHVATVLTTSESI